MKALQVLQWHKLLVTHLVSPPGDHGGHVAASRVPLDVSHHEMLWCVHHLLGYNNQWIEDIILNKQTIIIIIIIIIIVISLTALSNQNNEDPRRAKKTSSIQYVYRKCGPEY